MEKFCSLAQKGCNLPVPILLLVLSLSATLLLLSFFLPFPQVLLCKNKIKPDDDAPDYLHEIPPPIPLLRDGAAVGGGGGDMGPALILTEPASLRTVSARPTWSRRGVTMTWRWSAGGVTAIRLLCACAPPSSWRGERQSSSSTEVEIGFNSEFVFQF